MFNVHHALTIGWLYCTFNVFYPGYCELQTFVLPAHVTYVYFASQIFLDSGVPIDERNEDDQTPLHLACKGGHYE